MSNRLRNVHIDIETYSDVNLKKAGAYAYFADPSTRVLCVAWFDRDLPEEVHLWTPDMGPFAAAWSRDTVFWAWNASFEYRAFNTLPELPEIPLKDWRCTMALGAYCGYPLDLMRASRAVGVQLKDSQSGNLIRKCCTPYGKPTKKDYEDLFAYCQQDVRAEHSVWAAMPAPALPPNEQRIWALTQKAADLGTRIDMDLLVPLQTIRAEAEQDLAQEMIDLIGIKPTQVGKLALYLGEESVGKDHLEALVQTETDPTRKRAIEIRLEAAKSSCAKLDAMEACEVDGRVHGMTQYHGAHTGRDAGRLVQLQNLPARTETKATEDTVALAKAHPEYVGLLYPPLDFCSAHIRGCLIPSEGRAMYVGDYGQIEARVLALMAGSDELLDGFSRTDRDIYTEFGDRYGLGRQGGKTGILGLGFGMGGPRFQQTCLEWGAGEIELELAKEVVRGYREQYPEIPQFWAALFRMYWNATKLNGKIVAGPAGLYAKVVKDHLMIKLPSGRHLTYVSPRCEEIEKEWPSGDKSMVKAVTYLGLDSYTQRWTRKGLYGGLICENVVQATARDIMFHAVVRLDEEGFEGLFRVHDEIVAEGAPGREKEFLQVMSETPAWARGLPIVVEGGAVARYGK